jgi:DNA-binding transcriptional MerR regulator
MNKAPETYTLDELSSLVDLPKRTIRFYIQQSLLDRPEGSKRGSYYVRRHLDQLLEILKWQKAGLSLERIRDLIAGSGGEGPLPPPKRRKPGDVEVWSHLFVQEGIEVHIEPKLAGMTPEQVREFTRGVVALSKKIIGKESSE